MTDHDRWVRTLVHIDMAEHCVSLARRVQPGSSEELRRVLAEAAEMLEKATRLARREAES